MKGLFFIYEIFKKFPLLLASTILLLVLVSFLEVLSLVTVGPLVDFMIHPDLEGVSSLTEKAVKVMSFFHIPVEFKSYLLIFILFVVVSSAFRIFARRSILMTKYAVVRDLILGTFEDFFNARWHFFSSSKQGTLLNTFMRELNVVGDAFGAMAYFFVSIIQLIFFMAVPFYISWKVTLVSLFAALALSWPFILLGRISYRLGRLNTTTGNQISSVIQESLTLAKVILGFGNQRKNIDYLAKAFDAHCKVTVQSQTISMVIPVLYRPLGVIVMAVAMFSARRFNLPLSELAVLLLALLQSVIAIGDLTARKNALDNFFPSYEQIKSLRQRAKALMQRSGKKEFKGFNREIAVKAVSFAYPGNEPVLKGITMRIPKGEMIALVGESGAGKSTFVDMIMGFNEPAEGMLTLDQVPLFEFDITSYRKKIGYVPQDSILFNISIRDNLLWAKEDATEEEIKHACQLAYAREFIESFPEGYHTLVGDCGVRLSGGQRQRIALARAILRKPELLILDEATSSLDTYSERLIQKAIEDIARETTIIVIAHRLSTITNADYVYVFRAGQIVEEGSYEELIKLNGHFDRMVKLQLLETR